MGDVFDSCVPSKAFSAPCACVTQIGMGVLPQQPGRWNSLGTAIMRSQKTLAIPEELCVRHARLKMPPAPQLSLPIIINRVVDYQNLSLGCVA